MIPLFLMLRLYYLLLVTPGGGGYSTNFYAGRLRPEVQPLILLYTNVHEKGPLPYTFY